MRWGTLWLTAVMIAVTLAACSSGVITVENIPKPLDQSTPNGMLGENDDEQSSSTTSKEEGSLEITTPRPETSDGDEDQSENPSTDGGTTSDGSTTTTTEGPHDGDGNTTTECPDDGDGNTITESPPDNGNGDTTTEGLTGGGDGDTTTVCPDDGDGDTTTDCPPDNGNGDTTTDYPPDNGNGDTTTDCPPDNGNGDTTTEGLPDQSPPGEVAPNEELIVTTNSGKVQGFLWPEKKDIVSYIDIPYGTFYTKPFEAATAAEPWEMHSARDHDKRCPQIQDNGYVGNKDCLTLSIFKPIIADNASVLFYIHGDDFKTGSGDPFIYGPNYLVTNGIILVLPNYRLGPLGFLCMQNKTAPGNMALKDLSLALSWIHDNINFFGGNPDNIVVSGDGRSGALAELLALSPMSKNHVSKVISESGSLFSHWVLDRSPQSKVADFFDRMQEAEKSIKSRIDFSLEDLDLSAIVKAGNEIEFKPCVEAEDEDAFMTETPYAAIKNEKIETTFLMGSAMYAGLHEALHHTEDSIKELNENFDLLLPNDLAFPTLSSKAEIAGRVKRQYFGDQDITLDNVRNISLYFTDVGYLSPGIRSARLLAKAGATVYFYEFSFVGKFNRQLESLNSPVEGAVRGDIVGYLFTQDGRVPDVEDIDETKMVDMLTEMWTNFLTEGHPATETIKWNKLENKNHDEEEWLLIDSDKPSMQKGLHVARLPLWTYIYEEHFIENHARGLSPSVLTVLLFQLVFWLVFCRNVSHVF